MRMSDWSSDVCSSDLESPEPRVRLEPVGLPDDRLGRPKQQRAVRRNCAVQPFEDLAPRVGRQIKQQVAAKDDVETPRRRLVAGHVMLLKAHPAPHARQQQPFRPRLFEIGDKSSEESRVGKSVSVRVELGVRSILKKKKKTKH